MRQLAAELNRAIFSRSFLAAAAGTVAVLCAGAFDSFKQLFTATERLPAGLHDTALTGALGSDLMLLALPVLSALPATAGFVEDFRSGFVTHCLPREGRSRYIVAKAGAAAVSGALALAAGILAAYALFALVLLPAEAPPPPEAQSMAPALLGKAAMAIWCGALWPLVGLMCSAPTLSAHMAYASPFIVCYLLVILVARYFPAAAILSPQEWLRPARAWPGGNWGVALLIAEFMAIAAMGFAASASRRLRDE